MTISHQLSEYIAACFTGIWIESHEHDDAIAEIAQLCRDEDWRLATWDIAAGLHIAGQSEQVENSAADPLAAISAINALASPDGSALLVLRNVHKFLGSPEIIQRLAQQITTGKQNRTFVIVLAPVVQIPIELEKHFVVLEHELPGRDLTRSRPPNPAAGHLAVEIPNAKKSGLLTLHQGHVTPR